MRLIDADRLKQEIATIMPSRVEVNLVVDNQPDAIVRCKDCVKRSFDDCPVNGWMPNKTDGDWFCADGERKEGR